ncbi:hypothetical protein [Halobellus rubicundus]|uniref:CopG family transcriptional regulator n=1 Tax=Halobellus rubicundus TaxID=2996466 RepID=A0ABD5MHP1_9EURY
MPKATTDTIATLLESAIEETDDSEVHYKLRTALQLLDVVERRQESAIDLLTDEEFDGELRERLEELGYL